MGLIAKLLVWGFPYWRTHDFKVILNIFKPTAFIKTSPMDNSHLVKTIRLLSIKLVFHERLPAAMHWLNESSLPESGLYTPEAEVT